MILSPSPKPINAEAPRPGAAFLAHAGGGAAAEFSNLTEAIREAEAMAARNPGRTVGVYHRIGFAYQPLVVPTFVPTGPAETQGAGALIEHEDQT